MASIFILKMYTVKSFVVLRPHGNAQMREKITNNNKSFFEYIVLHKTLKNMYLGK